jgi:hypothetical protein
MFVLSWLLVLILWKRSKAPWYERSRVVESGNGHLNVDTKSLI